MSLAIRHNITPTALRQVTVGADPEFLFHDRGGMLRSARQLFGEREIRLSGDTHSNLGWDGHSSTGEIRPHYSNNPETVVKTIQNLFKEMVAQHPDIPDSMEILTGNGAGGEATGGHIHIGGYQPTLGHLGRDSIAQLLDTFLLPVALSLSSPKSIVCRLRTGYGAWTQFRTQEWGVEYRSLPSWLYHPHTAMFFLGYAHILSAMLVDGNLDFETLADFGCSPHLLVLANTPNSMVAAALRSERKRALHSIDLLSSIPGADNPQLRLATEFVRQMLNEGQYWDGVDALPSWLSFEFVPTPEVVIGDSLETITCQYIPIIHFGGAEMSLIGGDDLTLHQTTGGFVPPRPVADTFTDLPLIHPEILDDGDDDVEDGNPDDDEEEEEDEEESPAQIEEDSMRRPY